MTNNVAVINNPSLEVFAAMDIDKVLSSAGEFLWPAGGGPLENLFRFADWGTWLIGGPIFIPIVILASVLGYDFKSLGRWLDKTLGIKSFAELATMGIGTAVEKILGSFSAEELNEMQAEAVKAGIVKAPSEAKANQFFPLIKHAAGGKDEFTAMVSEVTDPRKEAMTNPNVERAKLKAAKIINDPQASDRKKRKARDMFKAVYAKALEEAKEKKKFLGKGRMETLFPPKGERMKGTWNALKYKGLPGGVLVALTSILGSFKDLAIKIVTTPFKFGLKHPIFAILSVLGGGAYLYFKDDAEPEKVYEAQPDETIFTEEVSKDVNEIARNKTLASREPKTFAEKVAFEIDSVISQAMGE